jgi:hypothetical protein
MNAVDDIRIRANVEHVTDEEAAAVVEWVRDWARDCQWADVDADGFSLMEVAPLLRYADRHIDGGIAFVLADVRDALTMDTRKPLADDLAEQGLTPDDLSRADVRADVLAAGWTDEEVRELMARELHHAFLADKLTHADAIAHAEAYGIADAYYAVRCEAASRDGVVIDADTNERLRFLATQEDAGSTLTPSEAFLHAIGREDVIAAGIAREAAQVFAYDEDGEDAESCAQRAADILRDLSSEDVPTFLTRVFGVPAEERSAEAEMRARWTHGVPEANDRETWDAWRMLRERAREDRGMPSDVQRVLLFEYADKLEPLAFAGHFEDDTMYGSPSTNLSAYREARAAVVKVMELRAHTFGGCSLAGTDNLLERLDAQAIDAALDALRWAIWNNCNAGGYDGSQEAGMPRAE